MAVNIEDVTMLEPVQKKWDEFLIGLRDLQVGQSFVVTKIPSNFRIVLSATQVLMGRRYMSRKEPDGYRIGRVL